MANFQEGSSRLNLPSGADFTSSGTVFNPPYTIVKLNASGQVVTAAASTDKLVGVLYNCPTAVGTADVLSINQQGTGKVTAGGTINIGDLLTTNSSGQAVATTTAGDTLIGQAVEAAVTGKVFAFLSFRGKY